MNGEKSKPGRNRTSRSLRPLSVIAKSIAAKEIDAGVSELPGAKAMTIPTRQERRTS